MSAFCPVLTLGAHTLYVLLSADSDVLEVESKHSQSNLSRCIENMTVDNFSYWTHHFRIWPRVGIRSEAF
jgi:hypothetical protein